MTVALAAPAGSEPAPSRRGGAGTISMVLGWLSLLAISIGVIVALLPVSNGPAQDCGAPGAFLLEGRPNEYPDADGRVQTTDGKGRQLSPLAVERAAARPCSERVAERMVPAGGLLTGGLVAGLACLLTHGIGALRRTRAAPAEPPPASAPGEPRPQSSADR